MRKLLIPFLKTLILTLLTFSLGLALGAYEDASVHAAGQEQAHNFEEP